LKIGRMIDLPIEKLADAYDKAIERIMGRKLEVA
jgi:hypothetical protein